MRSPSVQIPSDRPERLRILLVSANFRPSVGGIERYTEILAGGLARRGHAVTVLCCRTQGAPCAEEVDGVRIVRVPASEVLHRRANVPYPLPHPGAVCRELRHLVAETDVVNPQDALYLTTAASLAFSRKRGVPSVLTQHVAFVPQRRWLLDVAQRAAIQTLGRCAGLATRVVAYNPSVAEWAKQKWRLADVAVLPPGVPDAPPVERAALRRAFDLPQDRFVALFVGRDVPTKGLDTFLAARDPAVELVAVTDRTSRSAADGVRLLPFMESDRLRALLTSVDAFVLPSESEGFPLSLQEALVTGLPCVVTRIPGFDAYLRENEVVFVNRSPIALRDALIHLATHPGERAALADRARTAGRREFGIDRFVEAYETLYGEVVESTQPPPSRSMRE